MDVEQGTRAEIHHPAPWAVRYFRRCPEWHPKSCPFIVDSEGRTVVEMLQNVGHPGEYDPIADETAHRIVDLANRA
jgi:hypothetical protein